MQCKKMSLVWSLRWRWVNHNIYNDLWLSLAIKYTNLKKVHHRRCWRRWLISAMKQANYSLYIQHINLNLAHSSKPTFYGASNRFVVNFCWLGLFGGIWIYGLNYSHINRMFWWRVLPLKCSMKWDKTSHNRQWPDFGSPSLPVSISLLKTLV